jgi:hypothetical protein
MVYFFGDLSDSKNNESFCEKPPRHKNARKTNVIIRFPIFSLLKFVRLFDQNGARDFEMK